VPGITPRAGTSPPDESVKADGRLILVVDDEVDLLEVTQFVLESEGFRVETARNGKDALTFLHAGQRPGLVLLDLMMPVMNGWEFLTEVAKTPSLQAIPIVVLTAAGAKKIPGTQEVLHKPVDLGLLVTTIQRHVSGGG
jgi:CheY-like chemotaxis protein